MIGMEGTHDEEDEKLSFISMAAVTANVIRYLRLNKKKDEGSDEKYRRSPESRDENL